MTVSAEQRAALAGAVSGLRRIFEADYAALAEGKFGIHLAGRRAGQVEDATALSLSAHDLAARSELVGVVEYLRGEGLGAKEAVDRMVREAVFTTVNRLLAIRVAEAIGVLPSSLADGIRSEGFVEEVEAFPLLRDADDSGGYWAYLQICGDELSHAVPRLFDRRHPLSALVPSAEALDEAVRILADPVLVDIWVEPEALGWSYQFFNSQEERRAMREASSAPRDSRELAVRNQFFTPGYVVDFLLQNTLGRRLRESGYRLELPLLLGDVDEDAPPLDLDDVAVLDPAVGSGHFLLGAYDLLERAWEERGVGPVEAAPRIVGSLHGIEIDPRAAQVAQAVIHLRARRSSPTANLEAPAIVTARSLPRDPETRKEVLSSQPSIVRDLVGELSTALESAPDLGSLLKAEDVLAGALGERAERPQLGDDPSESIESVEAAVIQTATEIAHKADASPAERLFAAEAADALRFFEACARRYDVVLMNPPFGAPIPRTRDYVRDAYPRAAGDLYAAFVERGVAWLREPGYLGAITSRTGLFHRTFESWRGDLVLPRTCAVIDLGHGVLQDALVEVCAYALSATPHSRRASVRAALNASDKAAAVRLGESAQDWEVSIDEVLGLPGAPFAYWLGVEFRRLFKDLPQVESNAALIRQGLITGDDFRFFRLWWEPARRDVGKNRRWVPIAKGGPYAPFFGDIHLLVDWEDDGQRIREAGRGRVQNTDHYFTAGVTWSRATTSALSIRALPEGCIFSDHGCLARPIQGVDPRMLGAVLGSRLARYLAATMLAAGEGSASGTARNMFQVGVLQRLPWRNLGEETEALWEALHDACRDVRGSPDETTLSFSRCAMSEHAIETNLAAAYSLAHRLDAAVIRAFGLSDEAQAELDDREGPHPGGYGESGSIDPEDFSRLYGMRIDDLVDEAVARSGGARFLSTKSYALDRRLDLLAHLLRAHPRRLVALRDDLGLVRREDQVQLAEDQLSHAVGAAFGRWDVRVFNQTSVPPSPSQAFDPLPAWPPAMLLAEDGLPAADAPEGYPILLAPDRLLHDDPGHPWDVVRATEEAFETIVDESDDVLLRALSLLKSKDLRSYLRSSYFPRHVRRYSKSRRKAPIYWYLAVPSKNWGLWVYAPWLSREQLFAISQAAHEKVRRLSDQATQLRRDLEAGGAREARDRLEQTEDLIDELRVFHEKAEAVAQSGWDPDLNDGLILNAAPLEELFADTKWRKDISVHRKKMEEGRYPWATVQRDYFDRLKR